MSTSTFLDRFWSNLQGAFIKVKIECHFFLYLFWRARVCRPLLLLHVVHLRFFIFEGCLKFFKRSQTTVWKHSVTIAVLLEALIVLVEAVRKLASALRVTVEDMRVLEESHQFLKRTWKCLQRPNSAEEDSTPCTLYVVGVDSWLRSWLRDKVSYSQLPIHPLFLWIQSLYFCVFNGEWGQCISVPCFSFVCPQTVL